MSIETLNAKIRAAAQKRAARVAMMRAAGMTWAQIGTKLGVTRQRAQQIGSRAQK